MPSLETHQSSKVVKMLLVGHSGAGKTGTLPSLVKAGYRLFIADFDNGLDVLLDDKILPPELRKNVNFVTLTDPPVIPGTFSLPNAAIRFLGLLNNWEGQGGVTSWDDKTVVVIDSLTFQGRAFMNQTLAVNKRQGQQPWQSDWGDAMRMQEDCIALLYSEAVKCNVIVMSHLIPLSDKAQGPLEKLFPSALGTKLPPKIMRYFNNVIQIERKQDGKRVFKTQAGYNIDLKSSKPSSVPLEMDADLATYFKLVRG